MTKTTLAALAGSGILVAILVFVLALPAAAQPGNQLLDHGDNHEYPIEGDWDHGDDHNGDRDHGDNHEYPIEGDWDHGDAHNGDRDHGDNHEYPMRDHGDDHYSE